jgi:hypothetical protein
VHQISLFMKNSRGGKGDKTPADNLQSACKFQCKLYCRVLIYVRITCGYLSSFVFILLLLLGNSNYTDCTVYCSHGLNYGPQQENVIISGTLKT